ncbi:MAG: hypothetical protein FJ096_10920 [Deltaproteobacteria bacterium]|nr:hypothetical protein [Deltaproteobacteria bacterium]
MRAPHGLALALVAGHLLGCDSGPPAPSRAVTGTGTANATVAPNVSATPSVSASPSDTATPSGSEASATPVPMQPYTGPTGTLRGMIKIKGDPAPATPRVYPKGCEGEAGAMYGKLFRVGQDSALADAIVSVTRYKGFVPPKKQAIPVTVRGCAYSTRSIAMTDGQHIEVRNLETDTTSYLPWLDGAKLPAGIVATPQGTPVKLYSRGYGRYWLRDQMSRAFMVAHVFHFRYATTAVTGLDGAYRIEGIPVGKVDVSAMLPQANLLSVTKPFEIKEGEDNILDLELTFDAKRDVPELTEDTLSDGSRPGQPKTAP